MKPIVKQFKYGKHTVTLETGAMGRQADAAVMASMDDTSVFVTVVFLSSESSENVVISIGFTTFTTGDTKVGFIGYDVESDSPDSFLR